MTYTIKFPKDPIVTSDCHDRSQVKLTTGHPVAIKTLERLGCTVTAHVKDAPLTERAEIVMAIAHRIAQESESKAVSVTHIHDALTEYKEMLRNEDPLETAGFSKGVKSALAGLTARKGGE